MTYKLILGDCLDIMPTLEAGSIDAIITDLPYGTTACKWDTIIPFEPMWKEVRRVLKPRGVFVTTSCQPFSSALIMSNPKLFKYEWIWNKVTARGHLVAKKRPMAQHENVLVFGGTNYYPQMIKRPKDKVEYRKTTEYARTDIMGGVRNAPENVIYDEWYPKTILEYSNAGSSVNSNHSTQKPVPLYEYLIKTYTNEGETVLDIAMGSGTTIIAAENTGRNSIGIEKDEQIFLSAQKRIAELPIKML